MSGSPHSLLRLTRLAAPVALIALAVVMVAGGGIIPRVARAATLCVNPGGAGGCFNSIQLAVNNANVAGGDTINVAAGTYTEQVTITKGVAIAGAGQGVTIVKAPAVLVDTS